MQEIRAKNSYLTFACDFIKLSNIRSVVNGLCLSKSPGVDNLSALFWRQAGDPGCRLLERLFKLFVAHGHIPGIFKFAVITSVPKDRDGDLQYTSNFRPISVLNCALKIFEILVLSAIEDNTDIDDCISPYQAGFRRNRGAYDNLQEVCQHSIAVCEPLFIAFLDTHKAFDKAWRKGILYKLLSFGVPHFLVKIVACFFTDTFSIAKVFGGFTRVFETTSGVRQGSILSPFLFNILISDVIDALESSTVGIKWGYALLHALLYADDSTLAAKSRSDLQAMLNTFADFGRKWRLKVNPCKSKILTVVPDGRSGPFFLNGKKLKKCQTVKYLGVPFHKSGIHWQKYYRSLASKLDLQVGKLSRFLYLRHTLHPGILRNLYKTLVLSHIQYGLALLPFDQRIRIKLDLNKPAQWVTVLDWLNETHEKNVTRLFQGFKHTKTNSFRLLSGLPSIHYIHHKAQLNLLAKLHSTINNPAATLFRLEWEDNMTTWTPFFSAFYKLFSRIFDQSFDFSIISSSALLKIAFDKLMAFDMENSALKNYGDSGQSFFVQRLLEQSPQKFLKLEVFRFLTTASHIKTWFRSVSRCNFLFPHKFAPAACKFCNHGPSTLEHFSFKCPQFSEIRVDFFLSALCTQLRLLHKQLNYLNVLNQLEQDLDESLNQQRNTKRNKSSELLLKILDEADLTEDQQRRLQLMTMKMKTMKWLLRHLVSILLLKNLLLTWTLKPQHDLSRHLFLKLQKRFPKNFVQFFFLYVFFLHNPLFLRSTLLVGENDPDFRLLSFTFIVNFGVQVGSIVSFPQRNSGNPLVSYGIRKFILPICVFLGVVKLLLYQ